MQVWYYTLRVFIPMQVLFLTYGKEYTHSVLQMQGKGDTTEGTVGQGKSPLRKETLCFAFLWATPTTEGTQPLCPYGATFGRVSFLRKEECEF